MCMRIEKEEKKEELLLWRKHIGFVRRGVGLRMGGGWIHNTSLNGP